MVSAALLGEAEISAGVLVALNLQSRAIAVTGRVVEDLTETEYRALESVLADAEKIELRNYADRKQFESVCENAEWKDWKCELDLESAHDFTDLLQGFDRDRRKHRSPGDAPRIMRL